MNLQKYRDYAGEIDPEFAEYGETMRIICDCLASAPINLTAIKDEDGVLTKHILDSLFTARAIKTLASSPSAICDVGSGGGFPALPCAAVLPDFRVTAIDSTAKKCRYIESAAAQAGLTNITAHAARAEECTELFSSFDFVTARAVAALPVLLELCTPLLKKGGFFIAMKGASADEEIKSAESAEKVLGLRLAKKEDYSLPPLADWRTLAIYEKIADTPKNYPRPFARILKNPL